MKETIFYGNPCLLIELLSNNNKNFRGNVRRLLQDSVFVHCISGSNGKHFICCDCRNIMGIILWTAIDHYGKHGTSIDLRVDRDDYLLVSIFGFIKG